MKGFAEKTVGQCPLPVFYRQRSILSFSFTYSHLNLTFLTYPALVTSLVIGTQYLTHIQFKGSDVSFGACFYSMNFSAAQLLNCQEQHGRGTSVEKSCSYHGNQESERKKEEPERICNFPSHILSTQPPSRAHLTIQSPSQSPTY